MESAFPNHINIYGAAQKETSGNKVLTSREGKEALVRNFVPIAFLV